MDRMTVGDMRALAVEITITACEECMYYKERGPFIHEPGEEPVYKLGPWCYKADRRITGLTSIIPADCPFVVEQGVPKRKPRPNDIGQEW